MSRRRSGVVGFGMAMLMMLPGCPSESLTVADTYNELGRNLCNKLHECRDTTGLPPEVFVEAFGNNPDECVAILQPELDAEAARVQASVDAGRIRFDSDAAEDCLDAYADLTCAQLGMDGAAPACDRVFVGLVADGGACTISEDCIGSAYCDSETLRCTASTGEP